MQGLCVLYRKKRETLDYSGQVLYSGKWACIGMLKIQFISVIDIKFTVNGVQQKVDGDIGLF